MWISILHESSWAWSKHLETKPFCQIRNTFKTIKSIQIDWNPCNPSNPSNSNPLKSIQIHQIHLEGPEGLKTMFFVQQIIGCPLLHWSTDEWWSLFICWTVQQVQLRETLFNIIFKIVLKIRTDIKTKTILRYYLFCVNDDFDDDHPPNYAWSCTTYHLCQSRTIYEYPSTSSDDGSTCTEVPLNR